jgi:hypothetical protein
MSIGTNFYPKANSPGLRVTINEGSAVISNAVVDFPKADIALTANTTNYVYLDLALGLINKTTTGFPNGVWPICTAVTNATDVITLTDMRVDVFGSTGSSSSTALQLSNSPAPSAPSPLATATVPAGRNPLMWMFDATNNNWADYLFIDTTTNPPAGAVGTLTFSRRLWINDSGVDNLSSTAFIKNSLFGIYHIVGNQQNTGSSFADRAFGLRAETGNFPGTPPGGNPTLGNILGGYLELGIGGTPTLSPSGAEDAAATWRSILDDQHVGNITGTPLTAVSGFYDRNSAGTVNGCSVCHFGMRGTAQDLAVGNPTSGTGFVGVAGSANQSAGNTNGIGYGVYGGAANFGQGNYSIFGTDPGTGGTLRNNWSGFFQCNGKDRGALGVDGALVLRSGSSGGAGHTAFRQARFGAGAPGNTDVAGSLAFAAGTTSASYTFTESYTSAPTCFWQSNADPGAGIRIWSSATNTTLTFTASAAITLTIGYFCIGGN